MGREGSGDERARSDHTLFANLYAAQNSAVRCDPDVIANRHGLDAFLLFCIEIVLIGVKNP